MTDYLWPAVALVALVLAYRLLMHWLGNAPRLEIEQLRADVAIARRNHTELDRACTNVFAEWRTKVAELEAKCDRVVIDAKNEIAGDLATVSNITSKGWR